LVGGGGFFGGAAWCSEALVCLVEWGGEGGGVHGARCLKFCGKIERVVIGDHGENPKVHRDCVVRANWKGLLTRAAGESGRSLWWGKEETGRITPRNRWVQLSAITDHMRKGR